MQLDQIIIRPAKNQMVIHYSDEVKSGNTVIFDTTNDPTVAAVVSEAQQRLPTPETRPDREAIQKEIAILEERTLALKKSIGEA